MTQTKAELLQTRHQGDIRLGDANSSHYVGLKAPATVSSNLVWTLPATDGSSNQFLKTDGSGNLSWATDSATDSTKMPLAGGTFTGDVTFTGASYNLVWDKSDNALEFADNAKAAFGTSADLQIFHSGTNTVIDNNTGGLYLRNNVASDVGGDIFIQAKSGENSAKFTHDGNVELYFDNSKKLQTASHGVNFYDLSDTSILTQFQTSGGICGFVTGDGSTILGFQDSQQHWTVKGIKDGAVELYYDNSKKFETISSGVQVTGDLISTGNVKVPDSYSLLAGSGNDLQIFHDGTDSYLINATGQLILRTASVDSSVVCKPNAATELYYDGSKKFETTSTGVEVNGRIDILGTGTRIDIADNGKIILGDSNDLQIYHDGSNSYLDNATGELIPRSNVIRLRGKTGNETLAVFVENAASELYYDNSKKFETTSTGAKVTGNFQSSHSSNNDILLNAGDGSIEICRSGAGAFIDFKNSTSEDYDLRLSEGGGALNVSGNVVLADYKKFIVGNSSDLSIEHNGTHSIIHNITGNLSLQCNSGGELQLAKGGTFEHMLRAFPDAQVEIYYDGVKKFNTYAHGCNIEGDTIIAGELNLIGSSDENKFLDARVGTNAFHIRKITGGDAGHENMARFVGDGAVELFYDGSKKFETTSGGVEVTGALTVNGAALAGGGFASVQYFTSSGTWTKPSGIKIIRVTVIGGGGSGARSNSIYDYGGNGGGAGGFSQKIIDVTSISSETVTIGAGGAGVGYYSNGSGGGTSSFGSHCSASGGTGGAVPNGNGSSGASTAGVGSSGNINLRGGYGSVGTRGQNKAVAGTGGNSVMWGAVNPGGLATGGGAIATYGSGGGGAAGGGSSASGGSGLVVVEEFK